MLLTCPECQLPVSDKALTCPHCGYPFQSQAVPTPKPKSNKRKRLPNGFGQISEMKGHNLRNKFRAMVTVGKTPEGRPICKPLKPQAYFPTYNDAYAALLEYNRSPYDLDSEITVEELYQRWTEQYFKTLKSPSSVRTITSAWAYCKSVYTVPANAIRARHIKGCIDTAPSDNTKSRIKSLFNLMLDYAVEYEIVDKNYARTFDVNPPKAGTEHKSFTDDELNIMWEHLNVPFVEAILIQCYMGWRPQELINIKISDIDTVEWTITGGMKTEAGIDRAVPIHSRIRPLVQKYMREASINGSEWLITDLTGEHLTYDQLKGRFAKVVRTLKLSEEHRPHDGRKTFVTRCKEYNVDEYAIKYLVGHSITDLTEAVYTDRKPEWLRQEIEKIK